MMYDQQTKYDKNKCKSRNKLDNTSLASDNHNYIRILRAYKEDTQGANTLKIINAVASHSYITVQFKLCFS